MINNYDSVVACPYTATPHSQRQESASYTPTKRTWVSFVTVLVTLFCFTQSNAQVATNSGSGLAPTYATLAQAITALNAATITDPVVITLTGNETAPVGGYSITATGTSTNTITIQGSTSVITAPAQTSGSLVDAVFKISGGDWITIQNFTMNERAFTPVAADTAAGTNTMTEWGVALLYATSTNGAQNCTIQNNIISLNRTYQNTFGIYSNSTHSATSITTSATATTTAGGNSGLKVYGNAISNVNLGIVVVGPTAIADANTGIDIGGSSITTGNTISNFGTTGTFSGYLNVSGTVNGILVRNSNGINISYNSITSSNGGVTAGTLNGIQVQASTNAPTATFTNTITYNTISLQSGAATGGINGITYPSGSASATSIANVTNNDFVRLNHSVAASGTIVALSKASGDFTTNITNNTFTNLTCNTTGSFTFISHSITMPTGGTQTISGNSIVTGFNKTGAGGTVTCLTSAGSSINGTTATINNNNFSNITITGATAITGISSTDYLSASSIPTKIITNNIFNSWTGGTSAYTGLTASYWAGNSSVNTNTFTNWSGQGAITAINLGSTGSIATSINISNNTINNLSSTGTGGQVIGIASANTSTVININGNAINTFSTSGASSAVGGILITGATTTNVFSNTIYGMVASGITSPLALGVSVQGGTTVNTYGNKIYNISATAAISTTSPAVVGLNITGGSTVNSYNNLIGDLKAPAASLTDAIRGISIPSATSTTRNIYNNSIYLNASSTGTNFGTSGIYHIGALTATTSALNLQNNIIVNNSTAAGTGLTVAFRKDQPVYTNNVAASNKNLFHAGTPSASNLILFDGSNSSQTMSAFQTAVTPREANSFTEASFNPATFFVSTTGTDANYLKPAAGITTQAEGGGNTIAIASPDYNGVTRPGGTGVAYDVGAWEFEGVSPAPVLTSLVATPALTAQCTKTDRAIAIDVTTTSGTITSVTLNYSHNGTVQTPVTMTNSTGNTYTGTMIAPTTGNATVTWSISATNSIGLTSVFNGTSYADEPTTGVTATATASVNPICSGASTSLSMSVSRPGSITLGTGTALTGATTQPTAFCNRWTSYRMQTIYTAADLTSSGLSAGNISAMAFNITTLGDGATNANFTVRIGTTSQNTFATTAWLTPTYTTVFPAATYTHTASGWQTINFSTPYSWDGISNLIIDIQYDGANATNNSITYFTATTGNTVLHSDTSGKAAATGVLSTTRLNVQFTGNAAPSVTAYSWSDGTTTLGTTNPLVVSPTAATTYTGTATVAGCPMTASTLVNVNPLPTAPTVTASTQCGLAVPTASVADPNSFTTPTFKWYAAATAGTALQSSTSTTYTTAISATTTFYVSVINPTTGCESARTPVTVTVNVPDPIAATANDTTICLGESVTLTGANTASTPTQTYTYSWLSTANSGLTTAQTGASISVTPNTIGSYTYTATANGGGCQTTATVTVTVNALPNINSATASNTVSCVGNTINLAATASDISAGTSAPSGTGTSYTSSSGYPTFFGNYWRPDWSQMVYTATELQAMGLAAGDITSITFNIGALPDPTTVNGYSIRLGATSNNTLSAFQTTGLTTVYGPVNHTVTAAGNVTINFTTPYNWDGSSNIIVDVRGTGQWANANATTQYTTTTGNTVVYAYSSPANATFWTSNPTPTTSTSRPNVKFGGQIDTNTTANYAWTWSDGTATVLTAATGSVVLSASATYTATATNTTTGCASNSLPITVTANPLPTAPTVTASTQCGLAVPTASVADTNSFTTPTFKWYSAATAGTVLQSSPSTTYTTAISATTTFYVSVVNPTTGCESARTPVTVTVSQPDTIGATANDNSICLGESVTLTAANTASTPTQTYAYSWLSTANSGLTTAQTGASISVTPDDLGSYTYTVTATGGACQTIATVTVTVNAVPNITSATASASVACAGSTINLAATANDIAAGTATLGAGATDSSSTAQSFFPGFWGGTKTQYIIRASELTAAGISAGPITSLGFEPTDSGQTYQGFSVSLGSTSATTAPTTTFIPNTGLTLVYKGTGTDDGYTPVANTVNNLTFGTGVGTASNFDWDGSSNLVVSISWSRVPGATTATSTTMKVDNVGFVSSAYRQRDSVTPTAMANETSVLGTSSSRPKFVFGGQIDTNTTANYAWTWSNGTTTVLTAASGSVVLPTSATTTYTATATNATTGCASNSLPITVTANPLPTAPTATNSVQCGTIVPTASVSNTNTFASAAIYNWYATNTSTTPLQSSTSATFTSLVSTTTTFYVAVANPTTGCESTRTPVTVTVNIPDSLAASANDTTICLGQSVTISTANLASTPTQNYTYSWASTTGSGLTAGQTAASFTVTPTTDGSFTYTATGVDGLCQTTASVTVVVSALPVVTLDVPSTILACAGSTVNLGASVIDYLPGTATLGAGATTGTTYDAIFYHLYGGNKVQYLVTAAELTALGITAGDITALGIDMAAVTPQAYAGFAVSMASTANTNMSAGINSTATFSPVFSSASYTPTTGVNTFNFSTPYNWDGSSNILIQFCWSNNNGGGTSNYALVDTQSYVSAAYYRADNQTASAICGATATTGTTSRRPKFIFNAVVGTNQNANYAWTWSDGTTNVLTAASGTVTLPAGTTTYTATATHLVSGCSNVANSAQVVATAVSTTAPAGVNTIAPSSICFGGSVSLSLNYTGSTQGLVFQWQSSIDNGGSWQDIATATTSTFTTTQSVVTQYRCKLISCGGTPGYSSVATVGFTNTITSTTPATRCGTGTAIINAVANAGATISWYANASGGNPVGTGSPFTTPVLNANTTYYVSAETINTSSSFVGTASDVSSNLGSFGNYGMYLASINSATINSVGIYPSTAGTLNITLRNNLGTTVVSQAFTINASEISTSVLKTLNLTGFVVPAGATGWTLNYDLAINRGGGSYVYPSTLNGFSITGNTLNGDNITSGNRYYFYNWNVTTNAVCGSPRVPVTVTVNPSPALALSSSSATICSGSATAAITATAPAYDTFVWSPATGVSGNSTTGWIFSPTATTTYTLTASQSAGICENTVTYTVNVNAVPSAITFTPASPSVCVDDVLTLTAAGGVFSNSLLSQTMDFLPANFISSANATIANNTTYFAQGTGSVRFTVPTSANDWLALNQNVNLVGASSATLTFSHIAATEDGYDFGYVEYSTDGGSTWTTFAPANYAGTASTYAASSSFASDSYTDWASTFTSSASTPGAGPATSLWKTETFNIPAAALTSSQFRIRFRYTSDSSVNYYGWLIDDVKIQRSQSNITWSPVTNLYTNAAATTPYTAGTNATTVYVKSASAATTVYTATSTNTVTTCATNATVSVVVNPLPTVVTVNQTVCSPSTVDLTAAAVTTGSATGLTFTYFTNAAATTALTSPNAVATSGTYYIKGTNANGCSVVTPVTVTVNPLPVLTITNPATVCSPATVNITASAVTAGSDTGLTLTYWSDSTATTALTTASAVTTSGTYYIKAVNANGCVKIMPVTVTINVTSAPTGAATQTFCGSANITQLVATGSGVKWYDAATGGNLLPNITAIGLTNGTTYYASQTVNGCESTTRFAVTAVVNAIPTAPNASAQDFCSAPTVAQLLPNGSTINWYSASTGGTPLASTAVLSVTTYYVSQTINGCESARTAVTITISPIAAPTGAASQTIFGGVAADATIEDISVSGTNVIWYPTPGDAAAGTNAIAAGTQLVDGQTYYAVSVVGTCRSAALAVTVVVVLDNQNFDIKALRYYPNPVIDVLTISYTNEITAVQVYDISGRLVRDMKPNSNEVTVDLSDLAASVYVVKVFADTTSGEFKVVKK